MLFYFVFIFFMGKETVLKECSLKKNASFMYTLAIYLCFLCCYFTGFILFFRCIRLYKFHLGICIFCLYILF